MMNNKSHILLPCLIIAAIILSICCFGIAVGRAVVKDYKVYEDSHKEEFSPKTAITDSFGKNHIKDVLCMDVMDSFSFIIYTDHSDDIIIMFFDADKNMDYYMCSDMDNDKWEYSEYYDNRKDTRIVWGYIDTQRIGEVRINDGLADKYYKISYDYKGENHIFYFWYKEIENFGAYDVFYTDAG